MLNWNDELIDLVNKYINDTIDNPVINIYFHNIKLLFTYYLPMVNSLLLYILVG